MDTSGGNSDTGTAEERKGQRERAPEAKRDLDLRQEDSENYTRSATGGNKRAKTTATTTATSARTATTTSKQEGSSQEQAMLMSTDAATDTDERRNFKGSLPSLDVEQLKPPDDDKLLGFYLVEDDYVNGTSGDDKQEISDCLVKTIKRKGFFFRNCLSRLKFDLERFIDTGEKVILEQETSPDDTMRLAFQDDGFDEQLVHDLDIKAFLKDLRTVQTWHDPQKEIRDQYLAPILPVVQSSGSGKSRLLYEVRRLKPDSERKKDLESSESKKEPEAILQNTYFRSILLSSKKPEETKLVHRESYDVIHQVEYINELESLKGVTNQSENLESKRKAEMQKLRQLVIGECKRCIFEIVKEKGGEGFDGSDVYNITLLFDEAQHLTADDGFLFRVLRWIVREKDFYKAVFPNNDHPFSFNVTAVVAGTNSSLANFFPEESGKHTGSRYLDDIPNDYHDKGTEPFPPFFMFRTQGCLSSKMTDDDSSEDISTEYGDMIRFSRPLFAKLHKEGKLKRGSEFDIAVKIVLGRTEDWITDPKSCLSVLGTRVQMGPTCTSVVSTLVEKGYAHLTYFQNKRSAYKDIPSNASFAFLPDPVCARLAMCLMDEDFSRVRPKRPLSPANSKKKVEIRGQTKTRIVEMMGRIFSDGVCLPAKGDFGDVAVALFLLFCGDILRKDQCSEHEWYEHLSITFPLWMDKIWNSPHSTNKREGWEKLKINCIQFFRISFRRSLKELSDGSFLESLFVKGCAVYAPTNAEAIDLVIPCQVPDLVHVKSYDYIPVFVSVKNYAYLSPAEASNFLYQSYKALNDAGVVKGLLLLGIAGQEGKGLECSKYEDSWKDNYPDQANVLISAENWPDATNIFDKLYVGIFCLHDDQFGINQMLLNASFLKDKQVAEVYSMHSELINSRRINGKVDDSAFPTRYRKNAKDYYDETYGCVSEYAQRIDQLKKK